MAYHHDFSKLGFDWLEKRIAEEDLIPSQLVLREGLKKNLASLSKAGLKNLADAEKALSTPKKATALAQATGIGEDYLKVLGRVLRGYKPKPAALSEYPGIAAKNVKALAALNIATSLDLFEAATDKQALKALIQKSGVPDEVLSELLALSSLSRVQWVSPTFARLLYDAGYRSVVAVAMADGNKLCDEVDSINKKNGLYKGKIGARDMKRLAYLANMLK